MLTWGILGQLLWTGFAAATYYCLFAVAFSLVLKVNKIWNFAQAGVMVFAYYSLLVAFRHWGLPLVPALVFGLLITLAVSLALERCAFMVFRDRNSSILTLFIFTIVFSEFSVYLMELVFGTEPQTLYPSLLWPVDLYAGIAISHWDLMAIAVTAVLMLLLYLFIHRTRYGRYLIAVADNENLAEIYGISRKRAYGVSISIAAVLITAGMYLFGTKAALFPSTPLQHLLIFAVIATILAGIGNIFLAGIAAVALSLIQAFSILVIASKWQALLAYILIFVVIIFFPRGFALPRKLSGLVRPSGRSAAVAVADPAGD
jgi:branched-chain amino acid transport system permease protein